MAKKRIVDIVEELIQPYLVEIGLELVDIEFLKEGQDWYLRVFIDNANSVSLNDCQMVSEYLSDKLDDLDPIEQSYYLEVSSPGLDRPFKSEKDYIRNLGKQIEVSLYQGIENNKTYIGELMNLELNSITIKNEDNEIVVIEKNNIAKAKPAINIGSAK